MPESVQEADISWQLIRRGEAPSKNNATTTAFFQVFRKNLLRRRFDSRSELGFSCKGFKFWGRMKKPKNNINAFYPNTKFETLTGTSFWFLRVPGGSLKVYGFKCLKVVGCSISTFKKQCKNYRFFKCLGRICCGDGLTLFRSCDFLVRVSNFGGGWKNQKTIKTLFIRTPNLKLLLAHGFDFWGCLKVFRRQILVGSWLGDGRHLQKTMQILPLFLRV